MNREQFMKQLSYLLQDISDEDRTDALDYYENYLDEAGFGYETDITNELGSPERIAAIIRTSLLSNPDETGEFTDSGYENSRFKDPGYELAKQKLIDNTEAFVNGKQANNCLLYGDAGTGKSTSIKAIANQYYDRGLRLIEVYKHQFCDLNDVIAQIKNRNYKFIIYMDDLSFEEFEIEYKYLTAVIEGGLEKKPDNVLIYATSNRRHLIRETFSDKEEVREDMHTSDTVQEKLSLYARFGVSIYFGAPNKKEFQNIVKVLAEKYQVSMDEDTLLAEANKWELSHGGLSGRTAQQFINYLLGKE